MIITSDNIIVVDSIMGSGKTSWAIDYINKNPDEKILYVAPYLEEAERIGKSVEREVKYPKNKGNGKLGDIQDLLKSKKDIASTHALFSMLTDGSKEAVKEGEYTLFLDETIAAIEPYDLKYKDDIDYLIQKGSITIDRDGFVNWMDEDMDTRYNPIKALALNHSLFFVNRKLLMWRYPPEIFTLFKKVYILTYLFPSSILKYYFDFCKISYIVKSIKMEGENYTLCDYFEPDKRAFKEKIHIYNKADLNDCFTQKSTSLSAAWFKDTKNASKIKILKNKIYNYFTNKCKARNENIIWTTFKDAQFKLKGKGYSTRFVSCNCRGKNEYSNAKYLCYALNSYPNVGVTQFLYQHKIKISQDLYALSEMVQWIWRSNIRCGGEIYIYIPSKRMRKLLMDWLEKDDSEIILGSLPS